MWFSRNKEVDESIAVIDIGSGSIGAGIVSLSRSRSPRIIYSTRSPIVFQEKLDFEMFRRSMFASLDNALTVLTHEGVKKLGESGISDKKIDRVFVIFASPWYMAKTKTVLFRKGAPIAFDKKLVESLLKEEVSKLSNAFSSRGLETADNKPELVEHQVIDVKLNGYTLSNPYGKKAREIEMTLFMSLVSSNLLQEVKKTVGRFFHTDNIEFHSFALSSYSFIRDHFEDSQDYAIVDVSSEITDIFVADDGKLTNSSSFPFGSRSIVRLLTSRFGISEHEARSALFLFNSDELHEQEALKVKKVLGEAGAEWKKLFKDSLSKAVGDSNIRKVFVISEPNFEGTIKSFLSSTSTEPPQDEKAVSFKEEDIVLIKSGFFKGLIDMPQSSDAFIASEAYYADKLSKLNA